MLAVLETSNYCSQCGKEIALDRKFCSRDCKSLSQVKRITLICNACGKQFSVWPYLKRKTNFCSVKCYLDSTRRKQSAECVVCEKVFQIKEYLIKKGYGHYCSRKCQFSDYPARIDKICPYCGKKFSVQPSIGKLRKFCSEKCRDDVLRDYVTSVCKKCNNSFELPRGDLKRGRGNFCTYRCYLTYRGPSLLEEKMERVLNLAGIKFEREIKFKRFHVDFLLSDLKIVIECDGEHWHQKLVNQERDKRKEELLKSLGYKVLRFSGTTINKFSDKQLVNQISEILH